MGGFTAALQRFGIGRLTVVLGVAAGVAVVVGSPVGSGVGEGVAMPDHSCAWRNGATTAISSIGMYGA